MSEMFWISYALLWVLVIFMAALLLLVYRHFGLMALGTVDGVQRDGLPVGVVAPSFTGMSASDEIKDWPGPHPLGVLLFAAPGCEPCAKVLPHVQSLQQLAPELSVTVVVAGSSENATLIANKYKLTGDCLADRGTDVFGKFKVRVSPFAFVVDRDGRIRAKGLCTDPFRLRDLLDAGGLADIARRLDATIARPPTTFLAASNGVS